MFRIAIFSCKSNYKSAGLRIIGDISPHRNESATIALALRKALKVLTCKLHRRQNPEANKKGGYWRGQG